MEAIAWPKPKEEAVKPRMLSLSTVNNIIVPRPGLARRTSVHKPALASKSNKNRHEKCLAGRSGRLTVSNRNA